MQFAGGRIRIGTTEKRKKVPQELLHVLLSVNLLHSISVAR